MGYVLAMGHCISCGSPFAFNPLLVPSLRVDGQREPVCKRCAELINEMRGAKGLSTWDIDEDAYEGVDEEELWYGFDD